MPPKKKQLPAPIDRPLSRAYLREFTGWSTAFSPGLSEPTSLRVMENAQVNRDGSLKVRPGLRYLSYTELAEEGEETGGVGIDVPCVGSHEAFFLNDGTKAYLFAVRETNGTVGFRVLVLATSGALVRTLAEADFALPQGETTLRFSVETTYVKYLQIDNKIFALSDAGEPLRIFTVGQNKSARRISSLETPGWEVADKLTAVKPDAPWITSGVPISTRINLAPNPSFETNTDNVVAAVNTFFERSSVTKSVGSYSLRVSSAAQRTNLIPAPLHDVATTGIVGWTNPYSTGTISAVGASLRLARSGSSSGTNYFYASTEEKIPVVAGESYRIGYTLDSYSGATGVAYVLRYYGSTGAQIGEEKVITSALSTGRKESSAFTIPTGAVTASVKIRGARSGSTTARIDIHDVVMAKSSEATTAFHGGSGANYFWTGAANASPSVYHPAATARVDIRGGTVEAGKVYTAAAAIRNGSIARSAQVTLAFFNSTGGLLASTASAAANDTVAFTRRTVTATAPAGATYCEVWFSWAGVTRGDYHYVDELIVEQASSAGSYFDGSSVSTATLKYTWDGAAHNTSSRATEYSVATTAPTAETPTANTLISSDGTKNIYNFGYFYTFSNEVGESAPSQVSLLKTQRPFSAWKWEGANAAGEPNGTEVVDPAMAADQLVAVMPVDIYAAAKNQGALSWSLYMLTWSDQDPVPPEGILIETKAITAEGTHGTEGWIRHSPANIDGSVTMPIPSEANRINYSAPSSASQGLVAADRMVLVNDPANGAVIRWSSSQMGEYTNFSGNKGGGFKTLTSGNLFVPACVKLWQNPQSADTLTVLCMGVDGYSASYYMEPAAITSQTDSTQIMGFEETTATPGTCSPFGVEVMNNALYHPLETELMKSTAANYNINHKTMTELIANMWVGLQDKHHIVSSQLDNRMYLLVNNPHGEPIEAGCWGNELWVFDAAAEAGTWSRWLVQGQSLRKIEFDGRLLMSLVRPDGIYCFDDLLTYDEAVDVDRNIVARPISWRIETNTQGANRAHDAWAHLQQVNLTLGSFQGKLRYGVRGWDLNGKPVDVSKIVRDDNEESADGLPWDIEDNLNLRRDMKEWRFFAESIVEDGVIQPSSGQINLVQYRYTPVSVNVGYEFGSVETFEYARNAAVGNDTLSVNGVPTPYIETRRP